MNAPRVSVVIPTFNRARLVCETVDSVLRQGFRDFEILVIDDGSTDDTEAALARYGDAVRYVRQANRGMNPARNVGLSMARGDYVALLDSDDLWEGYKLELQVKLLDRFPDAGFAFSDFSIMKGESRREDGLATWHHPPHDWSRVYPQRHLYSNLGIEAPVPAADFPIYLGDVYERSLHEPMVLPSTSLIRRAALTRTGLTLPEVTETCGDWEFFARLSHLEGALYIDLETTINRSHEDAVRLTRVDPRLRLARRIAMIDRVWRADAAFLAANSAAIDGKQRELLKQLAKLHLLGSDSRAARAALAGAARLGGGHRSALEWATLACAHVPGSGPALRAARSAAFAMRQMMSGGSRTR
jgi:glycosyltransferase involved in cell wall biosynthesis